MEKGQVKLFSANANPKLAEEIAGYLGIPLGRAHVTTFSDGEIGLEIAESVRGADVYIVQPTCGPVNEHIMELLIMIDAMRRASARDITAVIPYYGYARQERKSRARDPVSAKLVANLITTAGADRVLTIDLHSGAIQGFFDILLEDLPVIPLWADYYKSKAISNAVVVSPDLKGITRARKLANRLGVDIALIDRRRPKPNVAEVTNIIGNVKGKTVIIVDDIIDTGWTMALGAKALMEAGAAEVYACVTHPVLSGSAEEVINESVIKEVVVTNSIYYRPRSENPRIKVLSVAPLLGEAISRIHEKISVSGLFE